MLSVLTPSCPWDGRPRPPLPGRLATGTRRKNTRMRSRCSLVGYRSKCGMAAARAAGQGTCRRVLGSGAGRAGGLLPRTHRGVIAWRARRAAVSEDLVVELPAGGSSGEHTVWRHWVTSRSGRTAPGGVRACVHKVAPRYRRACLTVCCRESPEQHGAMARLPTILSAVARGKCGMAAAHAAGRFAGARPRVYRARGPLCAAPTP